MDSSRFVRNGFTIIALMLLLVSGTVQGSSDVLTIHGKERTDVDEDRGSTSLKSFKSDVSRKNLLGLSRKSPLSLPDLALSSQDTLEIKVCAIRVQFQYEDVDDPNTTGRGHFDMRSQEVFQAEERHPIDMSPHNRSYFESHLRALNEYWMTASQGRIKLNYSVFPTAEDSVFTLSEEIAHYGEQAPQFGLGEFFVEAFTIADADTSIHFADYDAFVVFHAGADRQMDLDNPPTHSDLFTGFILLGPTLIVDDTVRITEGCIMPEAVSQDNRVIAMNGVFVHEFGHQLGLIDLYDTRTWMTQVGDFSLMDNQGRGTAADLGFERSRLVTDVLPVFPDAWSRAYLGFAEVLEVTSNMTDIDVAAAELDTDLLQIVKVPISDHEYYLIENRQVDSDADDSTNLRVDSLTGVILGPAPADPEDPRYLTRDYDFFLPGSGMLIWHIDETRAFMDYTNDGLSNFIENTLQWFNYYPCIIPNSLGLCIDSIQWENVRFVSIVEADGIVDFGGNYRTQFGSQEDMYYAGNNSALSSTTNPSSRSNSGAFTGVRIYNISGIDTIMTVSVEFETKLPGFPQFVNNSDLSPTLVHLDREGDRDGVEEVFVSGKRHVVAMHADGSRIFDNLPNQPILDSTFVLYSDTASGGMGGVVGPDGISIKGGKWIVDTLLAVASVSSHETILTSPLISDIDDDGVFELIVSTDSGRVYVWDVQDSDEDGFADSSAIFDSDSPITAGITVLSRGDGRCWLVFGNEDAVYLWDGVTGGESHMFDQLNDARDFAVDDVSGTVYCIAATDGGSWSLARLIPGSHSILHDFGGKDVIGFTAADLDHANGTDFAATTAGGELIILLSESSEDDALSVNEIQVASSLASDVVTAALDPAVPHYQIIFAGENLIYVYNHDGITFENFPAQVNIHRPVGMIECEPVIADADADGRPDILIGTDAGELFAIDAGGRTVGGYPRFAGSGDCLSYAVSEGTSATNYTGRLFAISDDNRLYGMTIKSRPLTAEESWYQSGRGALHQNFRGTSVLDPSGFSGNGLIVDFYNYPNPATNYTNIRFRLAEEGTVTIQVYDLSGRLVYEDQAAGAEVASEYKWNLDGYPSGVYICRLEASSSSSSEVQTHKIAVVK